jgi:hypothetical protein
VRASMLFNVIYLSFFLTAQAGKAEEAIQLKQYSEMYGNQELVISKIGCKIVSGKNYILLAKPPNWNVTVYNPKKQIYSDVSFKSWQGPTGFGINFVYGARFRFLKEVHSEPATVLNLPAKQITYKSAGLKKEITKDQQDLLPSGAVQTISTNITVPKELIVIINKYGRLPDTTGIPLEFAWFSRHGKSHRFLKTLSSTKISCTPLTFTVPPGTQRIKDSANVVVTKDEEGMIEDFFGASQKK